MARPDKISRFLPISFGNGTKVRRFAKHCPRCHAMVTAEAMNGLAWLLENKIFVAAKATCPVCQAHFSISCVITDNRHVHRVMTPDWLFRLWLRMAVRNRPQPAEQNTWQLEEESSPPARSGMFLTDSELVTHSGQIIGQFDGTPISSWIEYEGQRYAFSRAAPASGGVQLSTGEVLFDGKLVYYQAHNHTA